MTLLRISFVLGKVKSVLTFLANVFYRIICCRRYRSHADPILPITVTRTASDPAHSSKPNYNLNYSSSSAINRANYDQKFYSQTNQVTAVNQSNLNNEGCEDYFKDMAPSFTKQKKVTICLLYF